MSCISHGHYVVDHGKSWNRVVEFNRNSVAVMY